MKRINSVLLILTSIGIIACNSGGSSSSGGSTGVSPNPYPTAGTFPTMPDGFATAVPSFVQPQSSSLQIAWGYNTNPAALNLAAFVEMDYNGSWICSATPIESDGAGGTWLVGAAHCFVSSKTAGGVPNLLPTGSISISKGFGAAVFGESAPTRPRIIKALSATVYIPSNYCAGGAISGISDCKNFSSASGGQGNDIALIHINTKFNESEVYPQINNGSDYPAAYTMAPVLSLGYGDNNVTGGNGKLFYVVNYFYQESNARGYHYLYNSYFNPASGNYGYSELVCGGDSGGGDLYWNGTNWILLSEHTYGPENACGQFYNYLPNGATNVSAYYDWLQSIMKSSNPIAECNSGVIAGCVTNG